MNIATRPAAFTLDAAMLAACAARAADYDASGRFFTEDLADLKAAGYLNMAAPAAFGGGGLALAAAMRETRRLAAVAPSTALALNMHVLWIGYAAECRARGDHRFDWLLHESAAGELFAAGFSEPGNDMPVFLSTTTARRADGGWAFSGTKVFTSLAPAWTRLALCGLATDHPDGPRIVHGFAERGAPGIAPAGDWDVMGMRATRSEATRLDAVFVPDERIIHVAVPGEADDHTAGLFTWGLLGFANVYLGIAERAFALTVAAAGRRTALSLGKPVAHHPWVQHAVAAMTMTLQAVRADVEQTAADWQRRSEPAAAFLPRVLACKTNAVEGAWRVVDQAMDLAGGSGMARGGEIERLFRDARCGRFHPANAALTHEIVGKAALGLPLADAPRWG